MPSRVRISPSPALRGVGVLVISLLTLIGCSSEDSGDSSSDVTTTSKSPPPVLMTDDEPVADLVVIPNPMELTVGQGHIVMTTDEPVEPEVALDETALPELGQEGYRLDVNGEGIRIEAATDAGAFYAEQTLAQLVVPGSTQNESRIPFVSIVDTPRFEWRGYMLDVSRHFFDVDVIKKQIEVLATYKVNRLHLHLTDDQGWRIEIASWPELTNFGSTIDISGEGPGGFFTAEDYAEIIEFAASNFITVVPEIDIPGHSNAALASYANLNADGEKTELQGGYVSLEENGLSLDAPGTADFIDDVFTEIAEMTPGRYIHLGGDEAYGIEDEEYRELVQLAFDTIERNGKTAIGWEEVVVAELPDRMVVQHWLDPDKGRQAAAAGSKLIMSPGTGAYLDMKYNEETGPGLAWAGTVDLQRAYEWDPTDIGVDESQILGVEGALWAETLTSDALVDYMTYPRILGHAEIGWSQRDRRSWDDYKTRIAAHGPKLSEMGVGFYESELIEWTTTGSTDASAVIP